METPLVTVAVISYKAADFVIETLDSIKSQTYTNIELVVADDASPDGTAEICEEWIKNNANRFVRTELIASKTNGGVVVNSNRALNATKGEWFKIIGSDDVLLPDAIEKMMYFAAAHSDATFMFGNQIYFNNQLSNKQSYRYDGFDIKRICCGKQASAKGQYHILTKSFFGCAAASIGKTDMLREIGGFDERWPVEDWPLYINITKNGKKIFHIDDALVYRRIHCSSIMREKDENAILSNHSVKDALGGVGFLYENSNFIWRRFYNVKQWLNGNIVKSGNDKRIWKCRFWKFMARWFDPYNYYYILLIISDKILCLLSSKRNG